MGNRFEYLPEPFFIDKEINGYSVYGDGIAWLRDYGDGLELESIEWSKFELYPTWENRTDEFNEIQIDDEGKKEFVKDWIFQNYWEELYNYDF